ncbi:MAG: peptidase sortase [Aeromicrobium sp.]|nr:peptidase sortase [Aeromicrobium sp.]
MLLAALAVASVVAVLVPQAPAREGDRPAPARAAGPPAGVGRQAASQVVPRRPEAVRLPSGASMPVDVVATGGDGVLDLPPGIDRAGWWDGGSRIGDPFGTIVLAAHVDSITDGIGPFAELLRARPGQRVRLAGSGAAQEFEIVSVRLTPRASLSRQASIFSVRGPLRLVLITCAGPFDADRGGYRDNLIAVASPVGRRRASLE